MTSQDSSDATDATDATGGRRGSDQGRDGDGHDLWTLPPVEGIGIERVRYRTPRRRVLRGRAEEVAEAVEIVVRTAGPIPVRALSPALFVGGVQVTENVQEDETTYRFFADEELPAGEPIVLGWVGQPPPEEHVRAATNRYQPPGDAVTRP